MVKIKNIYIKDIKNYIDQEIEISGWLFNLRSSGKILFPIIRDGSGYLETIYLKSSHNESKFDDLSKLSQESSLTVIGKVKKHFKDENKCELEIIDFTIHHIAEEFPITKKEHGTNFLMDNRHLWIRSKKQFSILKIRSHLIKLIRNFFDNNGFLNIDTPIFTSNSCEGTTTLFETNYFDKKAYLTQSGQLYNEANMMAFNKVYSFGPTFRAEKSKTRRHLTEFWMVEPEIAFCGLNENMDWAEKLIKYVLNNIILECNYEFELLNKDVNKLKSFVNKTFPRITYSDAVEIINKNNGNMNWGNDFGANDETILSNNFNSPVFVHRFPASIKAFYMKLDNKDPKLALGMDLIAPEGYGEIIGGGERETDYNKLVKKINEHNLSKNDFKWYLDLRKFGSIQHAGFGLGVERFLCWICGIQHVRESIPFPRTINRLDP
tara:strand:- start:1130 stop:2434 length:1305 start_codon:yes stop_codon:yes gene_type:complete